MWHRAATLQQPTILDQQPRLLTRRQCPGPAIFMLRYRDTKLIIYIVHCNPDRALAEAMRFNLSLFLWRSAVRAPEVFAMLKVRLWAPTLQCYFSSCCRWLHAVIMFPEHAAHDWHVTPPQGVSGSGHRPRLCFPRVGGHMYWWSCAVCPGLDGCYVKLFLSLPRCLLSEEESALEIMIFMSPEACPHLRVHVIGWSHSRPGWSYDTWHAAEWTIVKLDPDLWHYPRDIYMVILSTWSPWLYKADQLLWTWLTAPPNYNSISIWNNGTRAGSQPIKCIYNSDIFIFSQPRLTAGCEKKMCARCANWKTEQQLIVMSSGKNSRMNKMQDIPSWPESSEAQTFPVYFWIVLFIGYFLPKFFAKLMSPSRDWVRQFSKKVKPHLLMRERSW